MDLNETQEEWNKIKHIAYRKRYDRVEVCYQVPVGTFLVGLQPTEYVLNDKYDNWYQEMNDLYGSDSL